MGEGSVDDGRRVALNFVTGGVAGMVARTVIAPAERVKIIFQTRVGRHGGWMSEVGRIVQESGGGIRGVTDFWKGNSVAVVRVFPYLGIQLASNDYYRLVVSRMSSKVGVPLSSEVRHFVAGSGAGMTAVFCTYPLDLARARMSLLLEQGALKVPSMLGTMRAVCAQEGSFFALYSGVGISMTGAALYCGIKFATYDVSKEFCRRNFLPDPDGPPSSLHRAMSGALAGLIAQTFVYPFDVLRRRLQTGGKEARKKYPGTLSGFYRLYCEEGLVRGLYRGCSLNYIKTVPNTTIYLALFDILKEQFT